ncbi:MAG: RNA polymerase sigma factor [Vicinamibacterales bacterium]
MDRDRELQLVTRLRAGDPDAFDEIHDAFNARLFNFLCRLSNRRDVAEDLLAETWLRLVRHAHKLRPETQLAAWLFTVARHLHVSYCRSRWLQDSRATDLIGLWPSHASAPSPFEAVEGIEAERRIATALASLPVAYREAVLLTAIEGLRPSEAAEICGVSGEAMRQRLSRARALLARRLADTEVPGLASLHEVTT